MEKAVLALAATSGQQRAVSSDLNHLDASSSFTSAKSQADDLDMLTASEWPGIPPEYVLQTPSQCRTLWRHFVADSELSVQQAMATQQAQRVSRPLLHQRCGICSVLPETVVLTLEPTSEVSSSRGQSCDLWGRHLLQGLARLSWD